MKKRHPCSRLLLIVLAALPTLPTLPTLLAGLAGLGTAASFAATPLTGPARSVIEKFLLVQTAGLPGKVTISVSAPSSGPLPLCDTLEPFLPQGAAAWGRVSVGLRCRAERPWTRFVAAHVTVVGSYFVAARAIDVGQALHAGDVTERTGDLTGLPRSVITHAAELNGVVATNRIAPGAPLRRELLRGVIVIQQGQTVRLIVQGPGFVVSTEGKAMTRAAIGQAVQVKTQEGRLVSGVAGEDGQVKLAQ